MRYLAATDGSTESDEAVRYAARHAAAFDAVLEIVHVLTPETELVGGQVVMAGGETAIAEGRRVLDRARELAEGVASDLTIETELLTGRATDAIAEHAVATGADAIYVGHRGVSGAGDRVVGSVAKSVVDKADVPVTVIR